MDDLDRTILAALRANARLPVSSLAAMTGASRATISARIDRLVKTGMITAFTITTGTGHEDTAIRAIVMIEVHGKSSDRVAERLRGLAEVTALHSTNGRWDFIVELEAHDLPDFDEALRRIRLIDGINSTESSLLLKTRKSTSIRS